MVTEAVLPVSSVMSGMCEEGMVTGWRDIAEGLAFLHDKVKNEVVVFLIIFSSSSSPSG